MRGVAAPLDSTVLASKGHATVRGRNHNHTLRPYGKPGCGNREGVNGCWLIAGDTERWGSVNRRPLPFSFSWMGLVLSLSFVACGWLQLSSTLVAAGVVVGAVTAAYTLLAARRRGNVE